MDSTVTYRGSVPELAGTSWTIPSTVISSGQAAAYIESQHRQQLAEEAAAAEQEQRQQSILAARLEQQRLAAEAAANPPAPTRSELEAGLREELSDLSQSVITAGGAIVGKAELVEAQTRAWESRHEALVATSEAAVQQAQSQVEAAMATSQAAAEQVQAELADHRMAVRTLENDLREIVSTLIGPEGKQGPEGIAGASTVLSLEDPLEVATDSFATRWLGRPLVDGDGVLVIRPNEILVRRWIGGGWSGGPAITPKQELINAQISAVDTGNKIYGPGGGGGAGGGSATGSDPLMVRTAAGSSGSSTQIADSSRWSLPLATRSLPSPTSATVALQLTAADGGQAGKSLFILCGLLYEPGGVSSIRSRYTEFSLLGDLKDNVEVDLTMQIQGAAAPGGLSVSVPAGVNAAAIYLSITRNAVGATRFILAGGVEWLLSQDTSPDASHPSLLPAWQL